MGEEKAVKLDTVAGTTTLEVKREGELDEKTNIAINAAVTKEVSEKVKEQITKVKDSLTANFVTILAIFASFMTFLGIEIQILKNICDYWRVIGFSFFILTSVLVFVFAIYIFIDNGESSKNSFNLIGMGFVVTILLGVGFYSLSKSEDEYVCKLTQLNDRFEELNTQYSKQNNQTIQSLEIRLKNLEVLKK